jgi:hypothetical protein
VGVRQRPLKAGRTRAVWSCSQPGCAPWQPIRRVAEGKTRREIIRCLKRYAAREIYRLIEASRRGAVQGPSGLLHYLLDTSSVLVHEVN